MLKFQGKKHVPVFQCCEDLFREGNLTLSQEALKIGVTLVNFPVFDILALVLLPYNP